MVYRYGGFRRPRSMMRRRVTVFARRRFARSRFMRRRPRFLRIRR